MTVATPRFIREIQRSHQTVAYVDVISPNQEIQRLHVIDGQVQVDRTAAFRRQCSLQCIDPGGIFIPDGNQGILTPFGTEVRPYRGIRYSDGEEELYPLGVFRISGSEFKESSTASANSGVRISLSMFDRSRTVARDKFVTVYTIPAGTNLVNAIKLILGRTFPDLNYDAISTNMVTTAPKVYKAGDDPWTAATDLAKSLGCELYFNVDGWVVIAPPTDVDSLPAPDFEYIEGHRNIMTDISSSYSDEPGYNGVIVEGSSPGDTLPPVRAEAWDTEPSSPTYRLGPYGEVPMFVTDTNVKTTADAQTMADSLLKGQIGFASQLSISSWTNPTFEAGDVVRVVRAKMHVDGLYAVDGFNIPLQSQATQNLKLRQKRSVG